MGVRGCPWMFVAWMDVVLGWSGFGGGATLFRFGGFHVLLQCPICSVTLAFVNSIKYFLLVIVFGSFYILYR